MFRKPREIASVSVRYWATTVVNRKTPNGHISKSFENPLVDRRRTNDVKARVNRTRRPNEFAFLRSLRIRPRVTDWFLKGKREETVISVLNYDSTLAAAKLTISFFIV